MQTNKYNCTHILRSNTCSTSGWRLGLNLKYPDTRNTRASKLLDAISADLKNMSDSQWADLEPYFNTSIWCSAVSLVCRRVGFDHVNDIDSFVAQLVSTLQAQAVA